MYNVLAVFNAVDNVSGVMARIGGNAETLDGKLRRIGGQMTNAGTQLTMGLTVPILGAVGAITNMATEFETSMTIAQTMTGSSADQFDLYQKKVRELMDILPQSGNELAKSLYFVASAGYRGQEAIDILTSSAKAAANSLADTETVAQSVVSVLAAYGLKGKDAGWVTDMLTMGVIEGTAEFEALAGSLGRVLPIAATAGVSFEEVMASLATMTRAGLSADEATTALRASLMNLYAPSKESVKALKGLGLSADDVRNAIQERGLLATLGMLMEKTGGNVETLDMLIPNVRGLVGVLATAGSQADAYKDILDKVKKAHGVTDEAFRITSETARVQWALLRNTVSLFGMEVADVLLPKLVSLAGKVRDWFAGLKEVNPGMIELGLKIAAVAAAAGPALIVLGSIATAIGALISPVGLVVVAIAALATAFATNFLGIRTAVVAAVSWISGVLGQLVSDLRTKDIKTVIDEWGPKAVTALGTLATSLAGAIAGKATEIATALGGWAQKLVDWVAPKIPGIKTELAGFLSGVKGWIGEKATELATKLGDWAAKLVGWVAPKIPGIKTALGEFLSAAKGWIGEKATELATKLDDWAKKLVEWVAPKIPLIKTEISGFIAKVGQFVVDNVPKVVKALSELGGKFIAWLAPRVAEILPKIGEFVGSVAGAVVIGIPTVIAALAGLALEFIIWVGGALVKAIPAIAAGIAQLATDILPKLNELAKSIVIWIQTDAKDDIAKGLKPWVDLFLNLVQDHVVPFLSEKLDEIVTAVSTWVTKTLEPMKTESGQLGNAIVAGISRGIEAGQQALQNTINWLIGLLPQWVRDLLGIHSPSTVFIAIGREVTSGLAVGITEEEATLLEAVTGLIDRTVGNVSSIIDSLAKDMPAPKTSIWAILSKAFYISQDVATFMSQSGMSEFVDWFDRTFKATLEQWRDSLSPLNSLLTTISGILDSTAEEVADAKTGVYTFFGRIEEVMRFSALWLSGFLQTSPDFISNFKTKFTPVLQDWSDSLEPLEPLLSTVKGILDTTGEDAGEVKMAVIDAFDRVLEMMGAIVGYYNYLTALGIDVAGGVKWFKDTLTPILADWNEALQPLAGVLSTVKSVLSAAGEEAVDVKLGVTRAFDQVRDLMVEIGEYYLRMKGLGIDIEGNIAWFKETLTPVLAEWNEALQPLSGLLGTVTSVLQAAGEEAAEAKLQVSTALENVRLIMVEVKGWIESHADFGSFVTGFKTVVTPVLEEWGKAIEPLGPLLSTAKSVLQPMGEEAGEVKVKVADLLTQVLGIMEDVDAWMSKNSTKLGKLVTAFKDTIGPTLADWTKALEPMSGFITTASGIISGLATDTETVKTNTLGFLDAVFSIAGATQDWLDQHKTFKDDLAKFVGNVDLAMGGLNAALVTVKGRFTQVMESIGALKTDLDTITADVAGLMTGMSGITGTAGGAVDVSILYALEAAVRAGMAGVQAAVSDGISLTSSLIRVKKVQLGGALYELVRDSTMTAAGYDTSWLGVAMVDGIIAGIQRQSGALSMAMAGAVNGAVVAMPQYGGSGQVAAASSTVQSSSRSEVHLHVGTLVADEAGLRELERRLRPIQEQEDARRGLA